MNLLDTAPVYGFGVSEDICGKGIEGRRDEVVLATKCGLVWHTVGGDHMFDGPEGPVYRYLGKEPIKHEVEVSLKRLRTDRIDLMQTHWQESQTPIADAMEALLELKQEGKIRAIGVSNCDVGQLTEYAAAGALDVDQERFSMLDRKMETEQLPWCASNGTSFLAYSPMEQGLLTGKVTADREFPEGDQRRDRPRFSPENRLKILAMLADFQPVADRHGITLAQLAIAWTVAQPGVTHALCGARNPQQAKENAAAGDVVLGDDDIATIEAALAKHQPE